MGAFGGVAPPSPAALDLRPPQSTDPLATLAQLGQLQSQRQEIQQRAALAPVQLGTAQLQQQQLQQQLTSQKAIADSLRNWDPSTPVASILPEAIKNGAMGNDIIAFLQHDAEMRQKNALASKDELDSRLKQHDELRGSVESIRSAPPEQKQQLWQDYLPRMESLLDPKDPRLPPTYPGDDLAAVISKSHAAESALSKEELERREGLKAGAEAGKATAETEKQQTINTLLKKAQEAQTTTGQHPIDTIIPNGVDDVLKGALKAQYDRGLQFTDPNTGLSQVSQRALENAAEFMQTRAKATNPQIRAGEAATAAAKATAEIPAKVATEEATNPLKLQQARASAMATSGVREALNIDQQYAKTASATEALGKVLDAADSGNKAAGSALPVLSAEGMNAIFGIKRINKFDIDQAGGLQAGNLWDRIVGWADKATIGQPIPQNIRDNIRDLHQILGENGYNQYTTSLNALSQRTGTDYKPTIQAPNIRKAAAAATVRMKAPDGTIKPVPADQVEHFKSKGATVVQ